MEVPQVEFLERLNKKAVARVAQNSQRALRDAQLENLQNQMAERGARLQEDLEKLKTVKKKGKDQQILNVEVRDQTTEFDIDEQYDGYRLAEEEGDDVGENFQKLLEAGRIVTDLSRELEVEVDVEEPDLDQQGNPQFDPQGNLITRTVKKKLFEGDELKKTLGTELYQPLVREGLMPETFVPDDFSETREMLDGSFGAYKERLEKEGLNHKVFSPENLAMASTLFTSGVAFVGSAGTIKGAVELDPTTVVPEYLEPGLSVFTENLHENRDMAAIADMTALTFDVLMTGKDAVSDIGALVSGSKSKEMIAPMRKIGMAISSISGIVLSQSIQGPNIPSTLAVGLSTLFNGKVDNSKVALGLIEALDETKKKDVGIQQAARVVGAAIDTALNEVDIKPATDKSLTHDCASAMSAIDFAAVAEDLRAQRYDRVVNAFEKMATIALDGCKTPIIAYLDSHAVGLDQTLQARITQELTDNINADAEESRRELAAIENERDEAKKASLIEEKIKQLERATKAMDWAVKLSSMSFAVASKFIGPLAIGGSLVKLIENTVKATARACDAAIFLEKKEDMLRAASPYSSAVANFVHNSRIQATHYSINAALDGLNIVGAVVETLGYASGMGAAAGAAAGKIIQATAAAGQALEAVLYEIAKRVDLERAWHFYRAALARPDNRKMGLKALKENPTLAKYAAAWGAVVKQDVLVADFVRSTGLSAESLRDPKAKVDQVVKYLELRMPDDNVAVGRSGKSDWEPATIELTAVCFVSAKAAAVKKAKLKDDSSREVEMALANYENDALSIRKTLASTLPAPVKLAKAGEMLGKGAMCWHNDTLYKNTAGKVITLPAGLAQTGFDLGTEAGIEVKESRDNITRLKRCCGKVTTSLMLYKPLTTKDERHLEMANFCSTLLELTRESEEVLTPAR